jgi:hypothetical protein
MRIATDKDGLTVMVKKYKLTFFNSVREIRSRVTYTYKNDRDTILKMILCK